MSDRSVIVEDGNGTMYDADHQHLRLHVEAPKPADVEPRLSDGQRVRAVIKGTVETSTSTNRQWIKNDNGAYTPVDACESVEVVPEPPQPGRWYRWENAPADFCWYVLPDGTLVSYLVNGFDSVRSVSEIDGPLVPCDPPAAFRDGQT